MNIALIGYGKMGKMIEQVAVVRGHKVVCILDSKSTDEDWQNISKADAAIEFTRPHAAVGNIHRCFDAKVPVAVGTTGWYAQLDEVKKRCAEENQTIMCATNFSIGVNLFFHVNKVLAKLMDSQPEYNVQIEEIHHTQKLDAPSGTAITLAEGVLSGLSRKSAWKLSDVARQEGDLSIHAIRTDDVPGTHTVSYTSAIDDIEIKHTAHSRAGFATGAVVAAEWLHNKKGFFSMNDLIGF